MIKNIVDELIVLGYADLAEVISKVDITESAAKSKFSEDIKKSVLKNIHLSGIMGKCGAMKSKDRFDLLTLLIEEEYLDKNGIKLTKKGIDYSSNYVSN
jgi:hypothetical protein